MDSRIETEIIEKFRNATNRLVLLDYDGTLVNYVPLPELATLPDHIFDILFELHDDPFTRIFIITGRGYRDIDKLFDHTPINIIAEHGAMIKEGGKWKTEIADNASWKNPVIEIFDQFTGVCPGSFIEEKLYSIAWHYRNADPDMAHIFSREIVSLLKKLPHSGNLKILDGKKVVEVLTKHTGKGLAVERLYEKNNYDFVLSIGDDVTDEEMFEFLLHHSNAITIKVGEGTTYARYKINSINEVVILLKLLLA
jgi:trehalose 6-phosphate synthase/phosphatase